MGASNIDVKACSTCAQPARPGQRTCAACHAVYMKSWRKKKSDLFAAMKAELERFRARGKARA